jgi:hypothetical protein
VAAYISYTEIWYETFVPSEYGITLWRESPNATLAANGDVEHCLDTNLYWYDYSEEFQYQPTSCIPLQGGEAFSKNGNDLYLVTYVQDSVSWDGEGHLCTRETEQLCLDRQEGNAAGYPKFEWPSNASDVDECKCSHHLEYFAKQSEEQKIAFEHGYTTKVDYQGTSMEASTSTDEIQVGWRGGTSSTRYGDIMTILQKPDGTRCEVDGKSEFTRTTTGPSLVGTLGEWLACAGVTLDTDPDTLHPSDFNAPQLRTMGLSLTFHLDYVNVHSYPHEGVVAVLTVKVLPKWTSKTSRDFTRIKRLSGQSASRDRYSYGVSVDIEVKGTFKFFNIEKFINGFVAALVIFTIPRILFEFLCLYCMGFISEVYRSAKRVPFNLYSQLHQVIARMMVCQGVYRSLICTQDGILNQARVTRLLADMFETELATGDLSKQEMSQVIDVIMASLADKDGTIKCNRFLTACSSNDLIRMEPLIKLLTNSEKRGRLATMFDSTASSLTDATKHSPSENLGKDVAGAAASAGTFLATAAGDAANLVGNAPQSVSGSLKRLQTAPLHSEGPSDVTVIENLPSDVNSGGSGSAVVIPGAVEDDIDEPQQAWQGSIRGAAKAQDRHNAPAPPAESDPNPLIVG